MQSIRLFGFILFFYQFDRYVHGKVESFIYGGEPANIENFPHSAHMSVSCKSHTRVMNWNCGSSIVNQDIILTAAHCVDDCDSDSYIFVSVGKEIKNTGFSTTVVKFYKHENYHTDRTIADIAVGKLKQPLTFTKDVKRVALMRRPPYHEEAAVAGWGLINEDMKIGTVMLQHIEQNFMKRSECNKYLGDVPIGAFCAGQFKSSKYVAIGDSGSALVVRGFIQIGIVSYKIPSISKSLVVYTDVGFYYNWIQENVRKLYCS